MAWRHGPPPFRSTRAEHGGHWERNEHTITKPMKRLIRLMLTASSQKPEWMFPNQAGQPLEQVEVRDEDLGKETDVAVEDGRRRW